MKEYLKKVLSFNGVSIFIGTAGAVFGIAIFLFPTIQTDKVNLRIVLGIIYVLISIIIVLVKIIYDLISERKSIKNETPITAIPFRYSADVNSFLIHNDSIFDYNSILTIYFDDSGCESPIGCGYVNNKQDKITQILVLRIADRYKSIMDQIVQGDANVLKHILIKSHFNQLIGEELIKWVNIKLLRF